MVSPFFGLRGDARRAHAHAHRAVHPQCAQRFSRDRYSPLGDEVRLVVFYLLDAGRWLVCHGHEAQRPRGQPQ